MIFEPFDVVVLPFPFADRAQTVARPALVLSPHAGFGERSGVVLVAMITSAKRSDWPFDVPIVDLDAAGLRIPCLIRMKLNTIAHELVDRRIGTLGEADRVAMRAAMRALFGGIF